MYRIGQKHKYTEAYCNLPLPSASSSSRRHEREVDEHNIHILITCMLVIALILNLSLLDRSSPRLTLYLTFSSLTTQNQAGNKSCTKRSRIASLFMLACSAFVSTMSSRNLGRQIRKDSASQYGVENWLNDDYQLVLCFLYWKRPWIGKNNLPIKHCFSARYPSPHELTSLRSQVCEKSCTCDRHSNSWELFNFHVIPCKGPVAKIIRKPACPVKRLNGQMYWTRRKYMVFPTLKSRSVRHGTGLHIQSSEYLLVVCRTTRVLRSTKMSVLSQPTSKVHIALQLKDCMFAGQ